MRRAAFFAFFLSILVAGGASARSPSPPQVQQLRAHASSETKRPEPLHVAFGLGKSPSAVRRVGWNATPPVMLDEFARTVGAKTYRDVYGTWAGAPPRILQNVRVMLAKADVVHFNLSEIDFFKFAAWKKSPDWYGSQVYTNYELAEILGHPQYRAKTIFYLDGKKTDPCARSHLVGTAEHLKAMTQMQSVLCGG